MTVQRRISNLVPRAFSLAREKALGTRLGEFPHNTADRQQTTSRMAIWTHMPSLPVTEPRLALDSLA